MNSGSHAVITPLNTVTNTSNGAALFLVTDTVPEIVTFTATYNGSLLATTPIVTFVSPPAAAGGITASPTTISADGGSTTTITVTLQDAQSNPSPGKVVTIAQGNGSSQIAQTTATTDATGQIKFTATDFVAEAVTYTATDLTDGLPIPGSATVNFVNPSGFCGAFGHVGLGTAATGYSVTTFASSFPNDCFLNVGPIGLAFDANGNLLVSDYGNNNLYKFGPQGGIADLAHLLVPSRTAAAEGWPSPRTGASTQRRRPGRRARPPSWKSIPRLAPFCASSPIRPPSRISVAHSVWLSTR